MSEIVDNIANGESSSADVIEMMRETFDFYAPHGSASRSLIIAGATISIPLAVGYAINTYFNRRRLKEKIAWGQLQNGGAIIGRVLSNHYIRHVFSLSDTESESIIDGCLSNKIKVITMKNVNNALTAANGIHRMSEQCGVIIVTPGQDLITLSNSVINFPLLVIGIPHMLGEGGPNPDLGNFKSIKNIRSIKDIAPSVEDALEEAITGEPGPVYLEFPYDLISPEEISSRLLTNYQHSKWYFGRVWNNLNNSFSFPSDDYDISFHHPRATPRVEAPNGGQIKNGLPTISLQELVLGTDHPETIVIDTTTSTDKNSIFGWQLNYQVDPSSFLHHLSYLMPRNYNKFNNWVFDLREKDSISSLILEKKSKVRGGQLNSYLVLEALKDTIKSSDQPPIIISDNGQFETNAHAVLANSVKSWIQLERQNMNNTSSIGLAIAAKLLNPHTDFHLPINIVVGNVEKDNTSSIVGLPNFASSSSDVVAEVQHPKTAFHKVMSAFGGKGYILSQANSKRDEMVNAFNDAKEKANSSQKPVLVNCWINPHIPSLINSGNSSM
eukprot:gene7688-9000_t